MRNPTVLCLDSLRDDRKSVLSVVHSDLGFLKVLFRTRYLNVSGRRFLPAAAAVEAGTKEDERRKCDQKDEKKTSDCG